MTASDRGAVPVHQDLGDLLCAAQSQVAFTLPALEESLHLEEVVDAQALDATVILQSEQRASALVREQLPGDAGEIAQIDGLDAAVERSADRLQQRPAMPDPGPLRFAPPQQFLEHVTVHEREQPAFVRDPPVAVDQNQLPDPEADRQSLREVRERPGLRPDAHRRETTGPQRPPHPPQKPEGDGRGSVTADDEKTARALHAASRANSPQDPRQCIATRSAVGTAPDQHEARRVVAQVRGRLHQRRGFRRTAHDRVGNGDEEALTPKLVEIKTLLAVLLGALRRQRTTHGEFRSYHTRLGPATRRDDAAPRRRSRCAGPLLLACALAVFPGRSTPSAVAGGWVATEHPLAVSAGLETLRRGGSAVDAAIAASTAIGVVNPVSCGLGGGGFMLVYDARAGTAHALDYRETAPAAATPPALGRRGIDHLTTGALAVAVPGEPAGVIAAHARFGVLPLATVLEPAIRYAREGFPIATHLAEAIAARTTLLRGDPTLAAVFLRADGTPRQEGEILRQPDLARSLERLAAEGDTPFYRGDIAAAVVTTLDAMDGLVAAADLAAYRVRWRVPLAGRYRHRAVFTMPPPGSGGVILEALNVLGAYDLSALGGPTAPTYLHLLAETMKAVFADRARFYGDPDFVDVPIAALTSEAHARAIRAQLSPTRVGDGISPGVADAGTAHISVLDDAGNGVAITTTINTAFGAGIVARNTGITLNNEMADFSLAPGAANVFGLVASAANVVAPRKRPLSSMSPTVVVRDGRAELVIGGSGGPMIITAVLQTILAVVDLGLSPLAAAQAPRIHHQGVPPILLAEPAVPATTRDALQRLGHTVRSAPGLGAVSFILAGPGGMGGAGEPRKGGVAAGTSAPRPASATPLAPATSGKPLD